MKNKEDLLPHNYLQYKDNILPPRTIEINDQEYKLFMATFENLENLYNYLKSNPKINKSTFIREASISNPSHFSGKPYSEALEDLIKPASKEYTELLKLQEKINYIAQIEMDKFKTYQKVTGGHLNTLAYSKGSPLCYEKRQRINVPKFVRLNLVLSYNITEFASSLINRAVILLNINALENSGYNVNINAFSLDKNTSVNDKEIAYINIQMKRHGEKVNLENLSKILFNIEFRRRILFRVLETLDVNNSWGSDYGNVCNKEIAQNVLHIEKNDLYFGYPYEMNILGFDLIKDFKNAINALNLEDKIDVDRSIEDLNNEELVLKIKDLQRKF